MSRPCRPSRDLSRHWGGSTLCCVSKSWSSVWKPNTGGHKFIHDKMALFSHDPSMFCHWRRLDGDLSQSFHWKIVDMCCVIFTCVLLVYFNWRKPILHVGANFVGEVAALSAFLFSLSLKVFAADSEWAERVPEAARPLPPPAGEPGQAQAASGRADTPQHYPRNPNGQRSPAGYDGIQLVHNNLFKLSMHEIYTVHIAVNLMHR